MGVGVYESNFKGTGTSFIVDGPLAREEDYASYVKESDDPVDRETWGQDEYDDFNRGLIEFVTGAAEELGFRATKRRGYDSSRAEFDSDISSLASNDVLEIGWRSWEIDFIVAVGADGKWFEWMSSPEGYEGEIILDRRRTAESTKAVYDELLNATDEYIRIRLLQFGADCRYRTSGYTAESYTLPENADERLLELKDIVKKSNAVLSCDPCEDEFLTTEQGRIAMSKAIVESRPDLKVEVPFYDGEGFVATTDPIGENVAANLSVSPEMKLVFEEVCDGIPTVDGLTPIPRNEKTEAWFAELAEDRWNRGVFLVDAESYAKANGYPIAFFYHDTGAEHGEVIEFPREQPAPGV